MKDISLKSRVIVRRLTTNIDNSDGRHSPNPMMRRYDRAGGNDRRREDHRWLSVTGGWACRDRRGPYRALRASTRPSAIGWLRRRIYPGGGDALPRHTFDMTASGNERRAVATTEQAKFVVVMMTAGIDR